MFWDRIEKLTMELEKDFKIFKNLKFLFIEGSNLSSKRKEILQTNIVKNGGMIPKDISKGIDYIICGSSFEKIENYIKENKLENSIIVCPEWISESIQNGSRLNEENFLIQRKRKLIEIDNQKVENKEDNVKKRKFELNPLNFACQISPEDNFNHNQEITDELEKLEQIYKLIGEQWKSLAYRKAIQVLKKIPKVTKIEQIKNVKGIGQKTFEKIAEYLEFGHMSRLESLENIESVKTITFFSSIYGVGAKTASKWYHNGKRSIEDLKDLKLTKQQEIGIKYFKDMQIRIPRKEIENIEQLLKEVACKLDENIIVTICGSYRRGNYSSGDIDVLLSDPNSKLDNLLEKILNELRKISFISDDITTSEKDSYMGMCKIDQYHRRIDIKVYPIEEYPFALLYFTGSNYFNRSMRFFCKKKGYSLSDKCIRKVVRVFQEKIHEADPIPCKNEKEIFDLLGLEYKEPHERNI